MGFFPSPIKRDNLDHGTHVEQHLWVWSGDQVSLHLAHWWPSPCCMCWRLGGTNLSLSLFVALCCRACFAYIYMHVVILVFAKIACTCEQRTKPITSAKGRGWNGHRFLCVPYRSWGFGVRGHEMSKWLKQIEAEAAERAAAEEKVAATAMKMNRIVSYQQGNHFGLSVGMCL